MIAIRSTTYQVHYANPRRTRMLDAEDVEERIREGEIGPDDRLSLAGGAQKRFWEFPRFASLKPDDHSEADDRRTPPVNARRQRAVSGDEEVIGMAADRAEAARQDRATRERSHSTIQQKMRNRAGAPESLGRTGPVAAPVSPERREAVSEREVIRGSRAERETNDAGFETEDSARKAEAIRKRYGTDPQRRTVRSDAQRAASSDAHRATSAVPHRRVASGPRPAVEQPIDGERAALRKHSRERIEEARRRAENGDPHAVQATPPAGSPNADRPRRAPAPTPGAQPAAFERRSSSASHPTVSSGFERTPSGRHQHSSGFHNALDPRNVVEARPFEERMLDGGLHGLRDALQVLPLPAILGVELMSPRAIITKAYHRRCEHVDQLWNSLLPEVRSMPVKVDVLRILQMTHELLVDADGHKRYAESARAGGQLPVFNEVFDFVSTEIRLSGGHVTAADEMLETAGFDLKRLYGDIQEDDRESRRAAAARRPGTTPHQQRVRAYGVLIVISAALAAWSLSKGC